MLLLVQFRSDFFVPLGGVGQAAFVGDLPGYRVPGNSWNISALDYVGRGRNPTFNEQQPVTITRDMHAEDALPGVVRRFFHYVRIDTQSDPHSTTTPSTEKQKFLSRLLVEELKELGIEDAYMDKYGYVFATLPSNLSSNNVSQLPVVALIAHVDTSPDESGKDVKPQIHWEYDGGRLVLDEENGVVLDPSIDRELEAHIGHDIITSDGSTLLGSDDKAGIALIMQYIEEALACDDCDRPTVRVCFTVDEEIGRGVDKLDLVKLGADVAYTLDGSGTDNISLETFCAAEATVHIAGVMVHPGYAKGKMVNALRIASDLISNLPANEAPETTDGAQGYYHPHELSSSGAQDAHVRILLRDFEEEGLARRKDYLEETVKRLRERYPGAEITIEISDTYKNMRSYIEARDPRVVTFAREAARRQGIGLATERIRGGTDGSRLSEMGLPTPNLFTGGYRFHSKLEWNTIQNLEHALTYLRGLISYWGEHAKENVPGAT